MECIGQSTKNSESHIMKSQLDMTFNEFTDWATGYVLIGLGSGENLRSIMHGIIDNAIRNKIFGAERSPLKKKKKNE
jgi:hypothetical protein